ncbi:PHP domain-containing protein [Patescibacteria group bacterium]|nr:PHP domain-containing protein [Patescibacteria group bacterium]
MSPKYIDLQIHSYLSDGMRGVAEIIKLAKKRNLKVISLTDHNTIAGVQEIMKLGKKNKIKVIPGVEIYTCYKNSMIHLLGYNFNPKNQYLNKILNKNQKDEIKRVKKIVSKFQKMGFKIVWSDIEKRIGSKFIDAGHIASILLDFPQNKIILKREIKNFPALRKDAIQAIIKKFIVKNKPAYVKIPCLSLGQVVEMIKRAGGFVVLAHPGDTFGRLNEKTMKYFIKNGVEGIEAISRRHTPEQDRYYLDLAKKYNLKITAGTDWHDYGNEKRNGKTLKFPYSIFLNLKI